MPLRSSKLKWAWRTQFLSHNLQILGKVIFFEDLQMILLSFLEIFNNAKVSKNVPKLSVQVERSPWPRSIQSQVHQVKRVDSRNPIPISPIQQNHGSRVSLAIKNALSLVVCFWEAYIFLSIEVHTKSLQVKGLHGPCLAKWKNYFRPQILIAYNFEAKH